MRKANSIMRIFHICIKFNNQNLTIKKDKVKLINSVIVIKKSRKSITSIKRAKKTYSYQKIKR